jgi:hypothetical protein
VSNFSGQRIQFGFVQVQHLDAMTPRAMKTMMLANYSVSRTGRKNR